MQRDVRDALSTRFGTYRIERQLHDVPPHEVYEVRVDGRRAVYKGDTGPTGKAGIEGHVIAFVDEHTTLPVPTVLHCGTDYYVAAWHPDAPAPTTDPVVDRAWATVAGRGLGRLHAETAPALHAYGRFRPESGTIRVTEAADWHGAATAYVERRRQVLARFGHADVAEAVLEFLRDRPEAFAGAGGPVCCHGWATPEHVSVVDDRVGCLVDFEHAIAAPGEFDYWRTVTPTFTGDRAHLERAFRSGYESVRALPSGLERRRPAYTLLNGTYYLESLYVQDHHGPEATAERADRLRERVFETLAAFE